jgi:hypothetical protein
MSERVVEDWVGMNESRVLLDLVSNCRFKLNCLEKSLGATGILKHGTKDLV